MNVAYFKLLRVEEDIHYLITVSVMGQVTVTRALYICNKAGIKVPRVAEEENVPFGKP